MKEIHSPHQLDTFEDLLEDGWWVEKRIDTNGQYDGILMIPPGYIETPDDLDVYDSATTPVVRFEAVQGDDTPPGRVAEGSVQSWVDHTGARHGAFDIERGRSAAELSRRVLRALGATVLQANWAADSGGLAGTVNYRDFIFERQRRERALVESKGWPLYKARQAVEQEANSIAETTWTGIHIAKPLGLTKATGFRVIEPPLRADRWRGGNIIRGYFVRPEE